MATHWQTAMSSKPFQLKISTKREFMNYSWRIYYYNILPKKSRAENKSVTQLKLGRTYWAFAKALCDCETWAISGGWLYLFSRINSLIEMSMCVVIVFKEYIVFSSKCKTETYYSKKMWKVLVTAWFEHWILFFDLWALCLELWTFNLKHGV